jgi:hypothetical protein
LSPLVLGSGLNCTARSESWIIMIILTQMFVPGEYESCVIDEMVSIGCLLSRVRGELIK